MSLPARPAEAAEQHQRDERVPHDATLERSCTPRMLTVPVPLAAQKRGGRKLVTTPGNMADHGSAGADSTLVKALAQPSRWRRMLETGRYGTIDELAVAEGINRSYVCRTAWAAWTFFP
jgi:hypothetical protein